MATVMGSRSKGRRYRYTVAREGTGRPDACSERCQSRFPSPRRSGGESRPTASVSEGTGGRGLRRTPTDIPVTTPSGGRDGHGSTPNTSLQATSQDIPWEDWGARGPRKPHRLAASPASCPRGPPIGRAANRHRVRGLPDTQFQAPQAGIRTVWFITTLRRIGSRTGRVQALVPASLCSDPTFSFSSLC